MARVDRRDEGAWHAALPVLPGLCAGEGVTGRLLRGDLVNDATPGTCLRMCSRGTGGGRLAAGRPASQFLGSMLDLARFAALFALDDGEVEALTLRAQLRAIFGDERLSARVMGPEQPFAVCPLCVGDQHLIALRWALPFVDGCEVHRTRLATHCGCGLRLRPFAGEAPFACTCGRPWAAIETQPLGERGRLRLSRLLHIYDVFLDDPSPLLVPASRAALALASPPTWVGGFLAGGRPMDANRALMLTSVGRLAKAFLDLGLPPERVRQVLPTPPARRTTCRNQSCELFGSDRQIRHNGARKGEWESYCMECGARFLGDRIILCFDLGHGDPRLSPWAVERARDRLDGWRAALEAIVARALAEGRGLLPGDALAAAGVPASPNLRARRLGLSAIANRLEGGGDPVPSFQVDPEVSALSVFRAPLRRAQIRAVLAPGIRRVAAPTAARGRHR